MNTYTRLFSSRFIFAVLVSLLAHALFWWHWHDLRAPAPAELPPLQARLVPLPDKLRHKPDQAKAKPAAAPAPVITAPAPRPPEEATPPAISAAPPAMEDLSAKRFADERAYKPALPKRARLSYSAEYSGITIGDSIHDFEIKNQSFSIHAETRTRGIAGLLKPYRIIQDSSGTIHADGLQPENYSETRIDSNGTQTYTAHFDQARQTLRLTDGNIQALPEQAQDMLSLPYHLSQLPLTLETLPIASSNGRVLNRYFIAVGDETTITTPLGKLRTIPLRKVRAQNETGLLVWLALEYRLLPVKITLLDQSGAISANLLINDIRVSDE